MTDFTPDPPPSSDGLGLQLMGALRDLLKVVGASMVAHGYMSDAYVEPVSGVLLAGLAMIWSQYVIAKKQREKLAAKSNPQP